MNQDQTNDEAVIVASATFKTPDVYDHLVVSEAHSLDEAKEIVDKYVKYGEAIRVDFYSDGSARAALLNR